MHTDAHASLWFMFHSLSLFHSRLLVLKYFVFFHLVLEQSHALPEPSHTKSTLAYLGQIVGYPPCSKKSSLVQGTE